MQLAYQLWDVFTKKAFAGNPLAVVPNAVKLTDAQMQGIAKEFNLSETSFLFPSKNADAKARYFTPTRELPMAGHPSVGSVYALHQLGEITDEVMVTLELKAGVTRMGLERSGDKLKRVWMNQGTPELVKTCGDAALFAEALGLEKGDFADLPAQIVSAGNPFLMIPVTSLDALADIKLNLPALERALDGQESVGVFVFTNEVRGVDVRCRMFGAAVGVSEDPATGSAHGPLGWYLAEHSQLRFSEGRASFISHQGVEMGRPSEILVSLEQVANNGEEGVGVYVGGSAVLVGEGALYL